MAQILKFSNGGNTSSWGKFTIDGVTYTMTEDNIKRMYDHAKTLSPEENYQFGFIINTLKSGKDLEYANNQLYGGVPFDTSDGQATSMRKGPRRGVGKGKDARNAISSLDKLQLSNPEPKKKTIDLSPRSMEYLRDDTGAYVLDTNNNRQYIKGANNQEILDLLDAIETYSISDEDFEITGIKDKDAKWLRNFYNSYGKDKWAELKASLTTGNWDNSTVEALNDINLFIDRELTANEKSAKLKKETEAETTKKEKEATALYDSRKMAKNDLYISYNENTKSFNITDETLRNQLLQMGNIWINDEFIQAYPQLAGLLENHPNGLFQINGKLYDANDPELLKNNIIQQWIAANKKTVGGSDIIKHDWISTPDTTWRESDKWGNNSVYNPYIKGYYRDLTGLYNTLGVYADQNIDHILQVMPDNITDNMYDQFGRIKPEYLEYIALSNGEKVSIEPESFNTYLEALQHAPKSAQDNYYRNIPSYLNEIRNIGGHKVIHLRDSLFFEPESNTWYQLVGNTLKKTTVSHKHGGTILKAQHGLSWNSYKSALKLAGDYNRRDARKAWLAAQPQHGGKESYGWNVQGSDVVELGRLLGSLWSTEKSNKELQRTYDETAIKLAPKYPIIQRSIYQDPTLKNQAQIEVFRRTPLYYTSDATVNALQSLLKEEKIRGLEMANNAQQSEAYNAYQNQIREINNQESAMRAEGENKYNQQLASIAQQKAAAKNATLTQNMESISNYLYKLSQEMDQGRQAKLGIQTMERMSQYDRQFNADLQKAYDALSEDQKMTDKDKETYRSVAEYMVNMYPKTVSEIKARLGLDYQKNIYNLSRGWYSPAMRYKKGGKTEPLSDKLLRQQNTATAKAIHSLNRDIVKLFLNMMK